MRFRGSDSRPVILRPGGMGDLILLTIAAEELGYDPKAFLWIIERRSRVWARHLGLHFLCYDEDFAHAHWRIAGRYVNVINTEQRFGLAQATALLACGRGSKLTCFDTNRAAKWASRVVSYDPDRMHETAAFQRILAAALQADSRVVEAPAPRPRRVAADAGPIVGIGGLQAPSRAFSEEEWERLIRPWIGASPFWLASSEDDRPFARRLQARFPGQAQVFEQGFDALCERISRSEKVFTVDGGFLHIASYYGVPVTAVFTSGRAEKWRPLGAGSVILKRGGLECQPCTWFGQVSVCHAEYACRDIGRMRAQDCVTGCGVAGPAR
jgi:hypothetical protein